VRRWVDPTSETQLERLSLAEVSEWRRRNNRLNKSVNKKKRKRKTMTIETFRSKFKHSSTCFEDGCPGHTATLRFYGSSVTWSYSNNLSRDPSITFQMPEFEALLDAIMQSGRFNNSDPILSCLQELKLFLLPGKCPADSHSWDGPHHKSGFETCSKCGDARISIK